MHTATESTLVPYITLREGEEPATAGLIFAADWPSQRLRLCYSDETRDDRDLRGVLWARVGQLPHDERGRLGGEPVWSFIHPARQREAMTTLRCQICMQPARTPLGYVFLAPPGPPDSAEAMVLTTQPPVCEQHIRPSAYLCPRLERRPMVYLASSAPMYGVLGHRYGYGGSGVDVVETPNEPVRYGDERLNVVLASQLVRRLSAFRRVDLDELMT